MAIPPRSILRQLLKSSLAGSLAIKRRARSRLVKATSGFTPKRSIWDRRSASANRSAFLLWPPARERTLHSYSLSVNGIHDESAGDPQPGEGDNPSDPPENDLPQLPEITPTLDYQLDVTLDGAGNVVQTAVAGQYRNRYFHELIDVPFGGEDDADSDDAGTFTIIAAGWTILLFDATGTTVDLGDHVHFSYQGGGTYSYDPTAADSDPEDETANQGDGDGSNATVPPPSGSVTGTYSYYGLHDYQSTLSGRVLTDGTPESLVLTTRGTIKSALPTAAAALISMETPAGQSSSTVPTASSTKVPSCWSSVVKTLRSRARVQ